MSFFAGPARQRMAVLATTTGLYIFVESGFIVIGPLWASRIAQNTGGEGTSESMVFTVAKVFQSGATMAVMALLGILEPHVGMQTLIWAGGVLGLATAFAITRLGAAQNV